MEKLKQKLNKLNDRINSLSKWDDYAVGLQREYDFILQQYNKKIKEIGEK